MQHWFKLSDPAMEEALHDVPAFRDLAGLSHWDEHIPSESSILRFRHLLERHKLADQILATVNALLQAKGLQLKAGTVVDATLIAPPTSTKNQSGERDLEMHQSKKGNKWYFWTEAHIGVDADSGLVHTVRGTSGNVGDVIDAQEENGADRHAVCAGQSVDGKAQVDGDGTGACARGVRPPRSGEMPPAQQREGRCARYSLKTGRY